MLKPETADPMNAAAAKPDGSQQGQFAWGGALVALTLVAYVPVVGFFAPMLFALAFIHLGLGTLAGMRGVPGGERVIEGIVVRS